MIQQTWGALHRRLSLSGGQGGDPGWVGALGLGPPHPQSRSHPSCSRSAPAELLCSRPIRPPTPTQPPPAPPSPPPPRSAPHCPGGGGRGRKGGTHPPSKEGWAGFGVVGGGEPLCTHGEGDFDVCPLPKWGEKWGHGVGQQEGLDGTQPKVPPPPTPKKEKLGSWGGGGVTTTHIDIAAG